MDEISHPWELHQFVFDAIPEPAIMINKFGIIMSANQSWLTSPMYRNRSEDYVNQHYLEVYKGNEELCNGITQVLHAQISVYNQTLNYHNHTYSVRVSPLNGEQSCVLGALILLGNPLEQRRKHELHLTTLPREFKLIAEHSKDLIKVTDTEGNVLYASPSHESVLGYIDLSNIFDYVHPDDSKRLMLLKKEILETKEARQLEMRKRTKHGDWIWLETVCSPVLTEEDEVQHLVFITRVITERKQLQDQLERMAYFDSLTGLYNRRKMRMIMDKTLEEAERGKGRSFAILIADLDKFKWVNDTYGHDVGDLVLKEFANRLLSCSNEKNAVGRLGGDEFSIVMKEVNGTEPVLQFIRRFQQALLEPFIIPHLERSIQIKSSIGFSMYPRHGITLKELLKYADNSLYKEKRITLKGIASTILRKSR